MSGRLPGQRAAPPVEFSDKDTSNPRQWHKSGERDETDFVNIFGRILHVRLNPQKDIDPTVPDLLADEDKKTSLAELKRRQTPFFVAKSRYGIDPEAAITINVKDALLYGRFGRNYQGLLIFIWATWSKAKKSDISTGVVGQTHGVWRVPFCDFDALRHKMPIHWYNGREEKSVSDPVRAKMLVQFEPRLQKHGVVYDVLALCGNAACSYVLDLGMIPKVYEGIPPTGRDETGPVGV